MKYLTLAVIACCKLITLSAQSTFIVTNVSNSGAGSLRQAIINANAIATTLPHNIVFNVPAGLLTSGVARIRVTSTVLPTIIVPVTINGGTQTTFGGNTNAGTWGTGGTVGRRSISLPVVDKPEVEVYATNNIAYGFELAASNITITGLAMTGFGGVLSNRHGNIIIRSGTGIIIRKNTFGFPAAGPFADPGSGIRTNGSHIIVGTHSTLSQTVSVSNIIIDSNLLAFSQYRGIFTPYSNSADQMRATINGLTIYKNEIVENGKGGGLSAGGIEILTGYQMPGSSISNLLISANRVNGHTSDAGIEIGYSPGDNNIDVLDNTVEGNSLGISLTSDFGVGLPNGGGNGGSNSSPDTIMNNIMSNSLGDAGISIVASRAGSILSRKSVLQNSIFNNANVGIDLSNASYSGFGLTLNDGTTNSTFGNDAYDYPVIVSSCPSAGDMYLQVYCRPGARIELFIANPDLYYGSPTCHGEGQVFIGTLLDNGTAPALNADGSANALAGILDNFNAMGSYAGPYGSCSEGTDASANAALFTIPQALLPGGYVSTNTFTATATDANGNTSEFGLNSLYNNCTWIILSTKVSSIKGWLIGSKTKIEWSSLSENGTTFFEIERSSDAQSFVKLGTVKAAGNSALKLSYGFDDAAPLAGISYYRLKTLFADGRFEYTSVISVNRLLSNGSYQPTSTIFDQSLKIAGYSETTENIEVCLLSINGVVVLRKNITAVKGYNNVDIPTTDILSKGLFILRIQQHSGISTYKLIRN